MKRISTIIVSLALATGMLATSAAALTMVERQVPASLASGCHGHSQPVSKPATGDFACCLVGHNHALQQDVFRSGGLLVAAILEPIAELGIANPDGTTPIVTVSLSSSPPGISPLRI